MGGPLGGAVGESEARSSGSPAIPKVHLMEFGKPFFPCCQRTAYTVPMQDDLTTDPNKVTCGK